MTVNEMLGYRLLSIGSFSITAGVIIFWILIAVFAKVSVKLVSRLLDRPVKRGKMDKGNAYAILSILKYLIWVVAITISLQAGGLNLGIVFAGSAALLVGLGFGIQQIFNDLMSGIILLFEGNLKVGDVIQLENDTVGEVRQMGLRTSRIKTRDNVVMIVPNSKFVSDRIINWSSEQVSTRFHVDVGVAYGADIGQVQSLLLGMASRHPRVEHLPEPFVRFKDFGSSSLDFQLFFWTTEIFTVENIKSDLRFEIDREFRANGVQIPFPQRDVHIVGQVQT
jgi:small-conductance mechanosensitive channel